MPQPSQTPGVNPSASPVSVPSQVVGGMANPGMGGPSKFSLPEIPVSPKATDQTPGAPNPFGANPLMPGMQPPIPGIGGPAAGGMPRPAINPTMMSAGQQPMPMRPQNPMTNAGSGTPIANTPSTNNYTPTGSLFNMPQMPSGVQSPMSGDWVSKIMSMKPPGQGMAGMGM